MLYEFKCYECQHIFSEMRSVSDDTEKATCPRCAGPCHRKFSVVGVFMEGAGFKEDDYMAFGGRHISSKRELKAAMREVEENSTYTYPGLEPGDDPIEWNHPLKLEANAL